MGGRLGRVSYFISIFIMLISVLTWGKCKDIVQDVSSMKKAHQQLIQSLLESQKLAIQELDELQMHIEMNQGQVDSEKVMDLKNNSQALKKRLLKSKILSEKLELASNNMLKKTPACFK